jgi:hypothetical protein
MYRQMLDTKNILLIALNHFLFANGISASDGTSASAILQMKSKNISPAQKQQFL